jgi:hypothetical protein
MNKTLLLILLDFLLLHMIHDSPWNKVEKENAHLSGGTDTYARHAEELQFVRLQMQANKEEAQGLADQLAFSRKSEVDQASAYAKAQADKTNLKGQLDKAHAALSETEKQRLIALKDAAERQEIINVKEEIINVKEEIINVKGQDINTIKEQVAKRDKAIITLTNTVERLNTNIGDLKNQIGDLKSDFSTKITNLDNTNRELARQNGELTANNNNLKTNLNTSRTQIASLDKNLKNTTNRLITTDQQLQAAKTTVTDLTLKNTTLAKQRVDALTAKVTAETQVKNLNTKIGEEQARTVAAKSLAQKQETRANGAEKQAVTYLAQSKAVAAERDTVKEINKRLETGIKKVTEGTAADARKTLEEVVAQSKRIPQSPNKLFNEYLANRVPVQIQLSRSKRGVVYINNKPFSAPSQIKKTTQPILVKGEKYLYAILHADQSPFALGPRSSPSWEKAEGMFSHNGKKAPVHWLGFLKNDPRIIAVPLHKDSESFLNIQKVYPLAKRPQDYPEAVIIHNGEDYGQVKFKVNPRLGNYVLMEKPTFIGKLFSRKFNPDKGDVVLSRAGELLGIMVNKKYCLVIREKELDDHTDSYASFVVLKDKSHISKLSNTLQRLTRIIKDKPNALH